MLLAPRGFFPCGAVLNLLVYSMVGEAQTYLGIC